MPVFQFTICTSWFARPWKIRKIRGTFVLQLFWPNHSRSSRRVPGHSRSNSRNTETDSRNVKFHSRNGISRLEQYWGSGGVKSIGVSQSVRVTSRDESQSVPSLKKIFKTRDLELPIFEGSLPSCSPHSAGYTRTSVQPYFPVPIRKP